MAPTSYKSKHKVLVAIPKGLLEETDLVATAEHRTRSDLIREALRSYIDKFKQKQLMALHEERGAHRHVSVVGQTPVALSQPAAYSSTPSSLPASLQ